MKKLFLLFLPLFLIANICSYKIDIRLEKDKIVGKSYIDFNKTIPIDPTNAQIFYIKDGTIKLSDYPKYIKTSKKPVEIGFFYKTKPVKDTYIFFDSWYPKVEKRCKYEVKADFGKFTPIMQYTSKKDGLFVFDVPLKNLYLIASKDFVIDSKRKDDLTVSTYFYKKDSKLSKKYIEKSFEYFDIYKKIFGFLPYKIFNIVEVPYPVGYATATMSLIGEQIISKEFVLNDSLAHEISHQYFGSYLFSPSFGNWTEGAATFFSNYYFSDNKIEFRKNALLKYNSYSKKDEISLIEFRYKEYEDKNVIGYNKGFFFFYMLKNLVNDENFYKAFRELLKEFAFKEVTFEDIREVFEKISKKDLKNFFLEWVYRKGAFDFDIENIILTYDKDRYRVDFEFISNEYNIKVPIKICSNVRCKKFYIDSNKTKHVINVDFEPKRLVVDDEYEIFRRLKEEEIPPIISKVLGSDNLLVVCDEQKRYKEFLKFFKSIKKSAQVDIEDFKKSDILIVGDSTLLEKFSIPFKYEKKAKIEAFKNPLNSKKVVVVFKNVEFDLKKITKLFSHLGKYSKVVFDKEVVKKIKPSANGAVYELNTKTEIVKIKDIEDNFNRLIGDIKNSKVLFVGENHPIYSHHVNQLKIIKAIFRQNKKIAIAMEMFQKPYQKYLDMFIEGKISEKEMLKKTQYLKRWGYDYNLYRPILLFARKHKIKLIALNLPKEISQKVAKKGIDSLSKKERELLPKSIDFSNKKYKKYIKEIFEGHMKKRFKNFENFFYAQILWDEAMAEGVVEFLKRKKDYKVVVLAGNGHLRYGFGIPDRVKRRGIKNYKIVLQDDKIKKNIADYVLKPSHIDLPSKKIGVYLKDKDSLVVDRVLENSAAKKAGIKKGDKILKIDGVKVKNLSQLKLELIFAKKCAKLEILRENKKLIKKVCFEQP